MNKVISILPLYKEEYNGFIIEQDPDYPIGSPFCLRALRIDDPETIFVDSSTIDLRMDIDNYNFENEITPYCNEVNQS
jgi:hypothetical protein